MSKPLIASLAIRVHNMDAMVAFYTEAFDIHFKTVDTFGLESKFGDLNGFTIKFVPIRDEVDFENYPVHQPGFKVPDIRKVIEIAVKHGGQAEGEVFEKDGKSNGAVRDPDGNTLELYQE